MDSILMFWLSTRNTEEQRFVSFLCSLKDELNITPRQTWISAQRKIMYYILLYTTYNIAKATVKKTRHYKNTWSVC